MQLQDLKEIASSTYNGENSLVAEIRSVSTFYLSSPATAPENSLMSTPPPFPVDSVGPPRAEVCRTAASFPLSRSPKVYRTQGGRGQRYPSHATLQPQSNKSLVSPTHLIHLSDV